MAEESLCRTFIIKSDRVIKNLEEAMDNGSPTVKMLSPPEAMARFKEATTFPLKRKPE